MATTAVTFAGFFLFSLWTVGKHDKLQYNYTLLYCIIQFLVL